VEKNTSRYVGALLGLAVGDAMGYTVDDKTWEQIRENYGPNGLLGYDLQNDFAEVTSYTQIAAYYANALLLGITRSRPDAYLRYIGMAMREWYKRQHFPRDPGKSWFWVAQKPTLRRRHCRDPWMMDAFRFENLGTIGKPINKSDSPGAITGAAAVALFYQPGRLEPAQVGTLTANAIAMTHGNPDAYLSGVVLAYGLAGILQEPDRPIGEHFTQAAQVMAGQFCGRFPQAQPIAEKICKAVALAQEDQEDHRQAMENFLCDTASECLQGAVFAAAVCPEDFDAAMILAVNHSGRSAAVGAITGAILGARLGSQALPDFYLESLEPIEELRELAADLALGSPSRGLFDDAWDQKYTHGMPL
jgi:ADP-ribosylglycohydrolase